jgi:hypothetical protein
MWVDESAFERAADYAAVLGHALASCDRSWSDQALISHRLKGSRLGVRVVDRFDHGNRVPAFGQNDPLAGAHGLNEKLGAINLLTDRQVGC